jgi:hypothetical protein
MFEFIYIEYRKNFKILALNGEITEYLKCGNKYNKQFYQALRDNVPSIFLQQSVIVMIPYPTDAKNANINLPYNFLC